MRLNISLFHSSWLILDVSLLNQAQYRNPITVKISPFSLEARPIKKYLRAPCVLANICGIHLSYSAAPFVSRETKLILNHLNIQIQVICLFVEYGIYIRMDLSLKKWVKILKVPGQKRFKRYGMDAE